MKSHGRYTVAGKPFGEYGDAQRHAWRLLNLGDDRVVVRSKAHDGRWFDLEAWTIGPSGKYAHEQFVDGRDPAPRRRGKAKAPRAKSRRTPFRGSADFIDSNGDRHRAVLEFEGTVGRDPSNGSRRSRGGASRQVWLDVSDASGDPTPVSLEQFERENPELDPADLREVRMLGIGEGFAISRGVRVRRVEAPPRPTPTRRGRGSTPSRRDPASRMLRDKPRGASPVARKPAKDTGTMTAGEVNRELEKLEKSYYLVVDELIKAGRGHETANDTWKLDDPLARRFKTISSRRGDLRNEIELRYGPRAPSRLPRGFGPRRDPASRGASPNRRRKR